MNGSIVAIVIGIASLLFVSGWGGIMVTSRFLRNGSNMAMNGYSLPVSYPNFAGVRYRLFHGLTVIVMLMVFVLLIFAGKLSLVPLLVPIQGALIAFLQICSRREQCAKDGEATVPDLPSDEANQSILLVWLRTTLAYSEFPALLFFLASLYASALQECWGNSSVFSSGYRVGGLVCGLFLLADFSGVFRLHEWRHLRVDSLTVKSASPFTKRQRLSWMVFGFILLASFAVAGAGRVLWHGTSWPKVASEALETAGLCMLFLLLFDFTRRFRLQPSKSRWLPGWLVLSDEQETATVRLNYLRGVDGFPLRRWNELLWGAVQLSAFLLTAFLLLKVDK